MKLPSYFEEFRRQIQPPSEVTRAQSAAHWALRKALANHADFGKHHLNTFLQGSYKRDTAIAPGKDVDIVVVTSIDTTQTGSSKAATELLGATLRGLYGSKAVAPQTRSFCVTTDGVQLDVVVAGSRELVTKLSDARTVADLEDPGAWIEHPLHIPDRALGVWVKTDPKAQLEFTTKLNKRHHQRFVPFVKMLKAWRRNAYSEPKYPKGYLLERIAAECFDGSSDDDATAFVRTLETIVDTFYVNRLLNTVPRLYDPGVEEHNVLERLEAGDFAIFYDKIKEARDVARRALDAADKKTSVSLWRLLFGTAFPEAPDFDASFPDAPVRPNKPAGFA